MSRLRDKIEVPELDDASALRIERRVLSELGSAAAPPARWVAPMRWLAAGIAVAGVAIAVAVNLAGAARSRGQVIARVAPVAGSPWDVETTAAPVTLRVGDATMELAPRSQASIHRGPRGAIDVALGRGRLDCELAPRRGRAPMVVGAGEVSVEVVGTIFYVARADDVEVGVSRGKVKVSSPGGVVMVGAGQRWTAGEGVTSVVARAGDPEAPDVAPDAGTRDTKSTSHRRPPGDRGAGAGLGSRTARVPAAGERRHGREARRRPKNDRPRGERPPRHAAPGDDPRLLEALQIEQRDPEAAVRAYERIAVRTRGGLASFALYSKAYVEYFRLHHRAAALETLDLFRRRFPRAREAESALWLQITALCSGGEMDRCRAAAYSYLRRYSGGRFAAAAKRIIKK